MNSASHQHLSLGIRSIATKLAKKGDTVLDLGPLSNLTAPLFLESKCRYFVEDLNDYFVSLDAESEDAELSLDDYLLKKPDDTKFDYILCWDLFNFLSVESISHLMNLLKPNMKPGTVLHTIRYTGASAVRQPKRFKHLGQFNYEIQMAEHPSENSKIAAQPHTTIMLLRTMPEFSLYETSLNKQGMMKDVAEYLLEYSHTDSDRKSRRKLSSDDVASYFTSTPNSNRITSHGIQKLFDASAQDQYESILEIGSTHGRSTTEVERRCRHFYIENVYASLTWQSRISGSTANTVSTQLLNFPATRKFDLVLLWDLFNFCTIEQIEKIGALLSRHLKPGAKLHALIHKSALVPPRPCSFTINPDLTTSLAGNQAGTNPKAFRSITELMRYLPQYKLCFHHLGDINSMHNYQDFILEFKE